MDILFLQIRKQNIKKTFKTTSGKLEKNTFMR